MNEYLVTHKSWRLDMRHKLLTLVCVSALKPSYQNPKKGILLGDNMKQASDGNSYL